MVHNTQVVFLDVHQCLVLLLQSYTSLLKHLPEQLQSSQMVESSTTFAATVNSFLIENLASQGGFAEKRTLCLNMVHVPTKGKAESAKGNLENCHLHWPWKLESRCLLLFEACLLLFKSLSCLHESCVLKPFLFKSAS